MSLFALLLGMLCFILTPINFSYAAQGHPLNAVCGVLSLVTGVMLFVKAAQAVD